MCPLPVANELSQMNPNGRAHSGVAPSTITPTPNMNQDSQNYPQDEHVEEIVETIYADGEEEPRKEGYWHKVGGGSLTISVMIHAIFIIIAIFLIIWQTNPNLTAPPPDFLPGGGGGGGGGEKMALKKQRTVTHAQPKMKLASVSQSTVTLPNVSSNMTQMPALTGLGFSIVAAAVLTAIAWFGLTTPWLLLLFCTLIGGGVALYSPSWQASIGEQVSEEHLSRSGARRR